MQKRIYVTIELPDAVKESFRKEEKRWKNLRVFWTGFSHLHLTLEYLGVADGEGLRQVRQALRAATEDLKPFDIRLDRIVLGPDEKQPTMFWATIREDETLRGLRRSLREQLGAEGYEFAEKDFTPHIVLAKARGNQLKGKKTSIPLTGKIPVGEINLFASQTYAGGIAKYKLVESYPLSK